MARLAAYYQEDFHYAPVGYGTKKKAAYVVYNEPKNNLFSANGGPRLRALASSDPALSPAYTYSPKTGIMTLKAKPRPFGNKLAEQSRLAVQRLERMYEPYEMPQLEADCFECESVYSQDLRNGHDSAYARTKSKHKPSRDYLNNALHPSEMYIGPERHIVPQSLQIRSFDGIRGEPTPHEYILDPCDDYLIPFQPYRSDTNISRWPHWPFISPSDIRGSPAMLSSPSPLDSGLSSQSITSSPSLDAEPIPMHPGPTHVVRSDPHHLCSCSKVYIEPHHFISSPNRYDSGRSSPGAYSSASKCRKSSVRVKNGKNMNNGIVYGENESDNEYARTQVRYGKLGLIGEPVQTLPVAPKVTNGHHQSSDYVANNNVPVAYYYVEENGGPLERRVPRPSKSHKPKTDYIRPSVVITEASDKSNSPTSTNGPSSPDQDSDKTPEPDSSLSTEASKTSSSFVSSCQEAESKEKRKSRKNALKEINELEDMYKKCNLGDHDLLERAERRDLPTAHQRKANLNAPTLTRSKSDTFYEMLGPTYTNPYENPRRAPPLRRSGIPDIIGDDMALRKNNKPVTSSSFNPADNTVTYMLCSSHFTPTVTSAGGRDILLMDSPDVEYDDLSYRKHYFGKKSKIMDPQPPFGIPLRPPPPQSLYNDYLHAVPPGPQPLCHPRGNPDVVRDDMAFRTLRKDESDRMYYETSDMYKKKRG